MLPFIHIFVQAKETAVQGLMDKLRDEVEKERLSQQRQRDALKMPERKVKAGPIIPLYCHFIYAAVTRRCE